MSSHPTALARRLTLTDAVVLGLGSMIGAGIFAAFAPAATAAGTGLLVGLVIAAAVAYLNASSSAQLAAQYPTSGGTYVYGRECLGPWPGFLAGWAFVIGKTASCAAMAMAFAAYVAPPAWQRPTAVVAVFSLAVVNTQGVARTAALGITLAIYGVVAVTALLTLGPQQLAASAAPLADVTRASGWTWAIPLVQLGAGVASLGALLALIAGVGRTSLAMARNDDLPRWLAAVHPRHRVPHHAELALAVIVSGLVVSVDLRSAIGFSSFGVLLYYAVANASAFTQAAPHRRSPRWMPIGGVAGCLALVTTLPGPSIAAGLAMLAVGVGYRMVRQRSRARWAPTDP